jgi:hypothetical protein
MILPFISAESLGLLCGRLFVTERKLSCQFSGNTSSRISATPEKKGVHAIPTPSATTPNQGPEIS